VIDPHEAGRLVRDLVAAQILGTPPVDQVLDQVLAHEPAAAFAVSGGLAGMLAAACRDNHVCDDPECRAMGLIPLVLRRNPDGSTEQVDIDLLPPEIKAFARMASAASRRDVAEMDRLFAGFVRHGQEPGDVDRARALLRHGAESVAPLVLAGRLR
jgi:hypothetical protein